VENVYVIFQQIYSEAMYQISSKSPSFVGDITKKTFWFLFPDTVYLYFYFCLIAYVRLLYWCFFIYNYN